MTLEEAKDRVARQNAFARRTGGQELNEEFAASLIRSWTTEGD